MIRFWSHVIIVLALAVTTVWVIYTPDRFTITPSDLTERIVIPADFSGWRHSRKGVGWLDRHQQVLKLDGLGLEYSSFVSTPIPSLHDHDFIKVDVTLRVDARFAATEEHHAGAVLLCLDGTGRYRWHWPNVIARADQTTTWETFSRVIPVGDFCTRMDLEFYATSADGALYVRDFQVHSAEEKIRYRYTRFALVPLWFLLILWTGLRLFDVGANRLLKTVAILTGLGVIIGGVMPQPHLNNSIKAVLFGTQDLFHEIVEWRDRQTADTPSPGAATTNDRTFETIEAPDSGNGHAKESPSHGQTAASQRTVQTDEPGISQFPTNALAASEHTEKTVQRTYWVPQWKNLDKKEHFFAFLVLTLISLTAFKHFGLRTVFVGLILTSGAIQSMQCLTITREFGMDDLIADLSGIASGFLLTLLASRLIKTLRRRPLAPADNPV